MSKLATIAIDVDEEFHNEAYDTKLKYEDFVSYTFHHVWGGTYEETGYKMEKFFDTHHFDQLPVMDGAYDSLKNLSEKYRLVIITSRQSSLKEKTEKYIEKHYPNIFDQVLLANHFGEGKKWSKSELCEEIGAKLLIDDNVLYTKDCAEKGIQTILFGKYPWHVNLNELHESTVHAHHWKDVEELILKKSFLK